VTRLGGANGLIFASYARREAVLAPAPPWLRKCGRTTACDRERRSDDLLTSLLIHDMRGMRSDPNAYSRWTISVLATDSKLSARSSAVLPGRVGRVTDLPPCSLVGSTNAEAHPSIPPRKALRQLGIDSPAAHQRIEVCPMVATSLIISSFGPGRGNCGAPGGFANGDAPSGGWVVAYFR
jgi:hypothetical protein